MKTWESRIDAAEKRGHFIMADKLDAGPWESCALSEHRGHYREAYYGGGVPISDQLCDYGTQFKDQVRANNIPAARAVHSRIQAWFQRKAKRTA